jgi:hypothetical protein
MCQKCSRGTFNNEPNQTQCRKCPSDYTELEGNQNASSCVQNPQLAKAKSDAALAKDESAQAASSAKMLLYASLGAALFFIVLLGCAARWYISAAEAKVQQAELKAQQAEMENQTRELNFMRDWNIKPTEIVFLDDKPVAKGAEGEVWRGRMHGRSGEVAIKKQNQMGSTNSSHVWDEKEIAFMMSMPHARLVTFIGAGQLFDSKMEQLISFSVQEFMSGGSLDGRLWDQPQGYVTWGEKLQWAADVCEVSPLTLTTWLC